MKAILLLKQTSLSSISASHSFNNFDSQVKKNVTSLSMKGNQFDLTCEGQLL
jgi:hypothetical protein